MRKLILVLLIVAFAAPASAEFQSQEDVSKWLTFYYQMPEPNRLPEAVEYMSQSGMLDNQDAMAPIFGFISGVLSDNPGQAAGWVDMLSSLKEEHLGVVVLGIWYANLPESQNIAYTILDNHPSLNKQFVFLREGKPMTVDQIPVEQGAWVLDALWGKFMATGRKEPVERIMAVLPWIDIKGDVNRLLVGGAARWSLASNAVQHDLVFKFCEEAMKNQSEEVTLKLQEVLENSEKDRQERHNKSL